MALLLEGKNCVITSGAHGLGFAIAKLFAEQGARVAICGRSSSGVQSGEELSVITKGSFFFQCDLSDLDQVNRFGDEVIRRMGCVDVLVNCVGTNIRESLTEIRMENFDFVQNVNLKAAIVLLEKVLPVMIKNGVRGSIVNISSIHSIAPAAAMGAYASSKGALNALSRVLAIEVGKYGIRTNTLCPGWIATTYIYHDLGELRHNREKQYAELEKLNGSAPCLSPARAEDVAMHALFFASNMSAYMTGSTIMDDGGASLQTHYTVFSEPDCAYEMRRALYDAILKSEYAK